jgi:hypothetical protein
MKILLFFQAVSKLVVVLFCYSLFQGSFAYAKSIPIIWNVPSPNEYFVGRTLELQRLKEIIKKHNTAIITGPGGIGKTQLAKKYVHDNASNYEIIWWFDMSKSIDDQLNSLARCLNKAHIGNAINVDKVSASAVLLHIREALRTTDRSWLVVFDNVENISLIKDYIPESHNRKNKNILITTKNSNGTLPSLYLNVFTSEEASKFLLQATKVSDQSDLNKLSELLSFYPLSLAQAAAYIKTNNISIPDYISLYHQDLYRLLDSESLVVQENGGYFDLNKRTMELAVRLNLENVQRESLVSLEVIKIFSLINVAVIPEYLLKDFIKANEVYDEEEFKTAVRVLRKYSLIEDRTKNGKKYYQVHDAVRKIVRKLFAESAGNFISFKNHESFDQSSFENTYKKILKVMCLYLDKPWGEMIDYVNQNPELINIATTISFSAYKDNITDPALIKLMISLLEHNNMIFHTKSNYKTYQELAERLYSLFVDKRMHVPLIFQARYYFNGIYADFIFKSKEMSDKYEGKLIDLLTLLEGKTEFTEERFLAFINMAEFCLFRGNITQGIYYINKAYLLLPKISNVNYQAQFWYAITWLYIEKGDYLKANENITTFFKVTQHNKNYPIHLYAMNFRASINFHLNRFNEAHLWAEKCYNDSIDFFKSDISDITAESLINLARYYKANKDYTKSLARAQKAIDILNIIFGGPEIDPSQAAAHILLGEIYEAQHRYKQAYDEYVFAERYCTKFYKNNFSNIHEVSTLFKNFVMLGIKTHDKILVKRYLKKLVDTFSYKNSNTKAVIEELSNQEINILS